MKRLALVAAAASAAGVLVFAVSASGGRAPFSTVTGTAAPAPGGGAILTITNQGPDPIQGQRGIAPNNKQLDGAQQEGTQCQHQGNQWACFPFKVPANGTFQVLLHSPQGLTPSDGPFTMFVTTDLRTDTGPFTIPWTAVGVRKCKCKKLAVGISSVASGQLTNPAGPAHLNIGFFWRLTCTTGKGKCRGKVSVSAPAGSDIKITSGASVTCRAPCNASSAGKFTMKATSANDLDFDKRANKSFVFKVKKTCGAGSKTQRFTLAFGGRGFLDRKKSDLNGNGIPDGKEKK